ncbi:MAG: hypothetical protein KY455_12415 [Euryarchaeota archaeon]|nr:hypothetical protein [Euryarchaeota archaeon]
MQDDHSTAQQDAYERAVGPETTRPSKRGAIAMIIVGALFLLPFALISVSQGLFFSPAAFLEALLTVGWTFFLGVIFLSFGWRRLKTVTEGDDAEQGP